MKVTALQAQEISHKLSIISETWADDPDCHERPTEEYEAAACVAAKVSLIYPRGGALELDAAELELVKSEVENLLDIARSNAAPADVDYDHIGAYISSMTNLIRKLEAIS